MRHEERAQNGQVAHSDVRKDTQTCSTDLGTSLIAGLRELLQKFACCLFALFCLRRVEVPQGRGSMEHSRVEVLLFVRVASCSQRFFSCYTCRRPLLLFRKPGLRQPCAEGCECTCKYVHLHAVRGCDDVVGDCKAQGKDCKAQGKTPATHLHLFQIDRQLLAGSHNFPEDRRYGARMHLEHGLM